MKKAFKIAGAIAGAAALIGLVPYSFYNKDGKTGEVSTYALLWKLSTRPNPEGGKDIELHFGFHNPLSQKGGDELECQWVTGDAPAGDGENITLTLEPDLSDLPGAPAEAPAEAPAPAAPQA